MSVVPGGNVFEVLNANDVTPILWQFVLLPKFLHLGSVENSSHHMSYPINKWLPLIMPLKHHGIAIYF